MKSLERQLQEQATEISELRKRLGKTGTATTLVQELSESGLPQAAQSRLQKRLPATATKEVIKRAIAEERELVRQIRTPGNQARLAESYRLLGLSDKESGIAAGVEVAVKNITESRQKLANAALLLGMTEAQADIFSKI